ncbi:MAG: hypothetical protein PHU40_07130 [Sulfurimonas sp.]|nr:hypothetical protein [Sulfurimonas sp.]
MIFKILLFYFFSATLFASGVYNQNILNIQAKVFPKIILSDNHLEDKLQDNSVVLTILYEEIDANAAQILKKSIEKNYPSLKNYKLEVILTKYNDFKSDRLSSSYFFLLGDTKQITQISNVLTTKSRLSFAYDDRYLDFGVIFGLKMSSKIDILLNLKKLKESKIELQNSIFNVVIMR